VIARASSQKPTKIHSTGLAIIGKRASANSVAGRGQITGLGAHRGWIRGFNQWIQYWNFGSFSTQLERLMAVRLLLDAGFNLRAAVCLSAGSVVAGRRIPPILFGQIVSKYDRDCSHAPRAHSLGEFDCEHEDTASDRRPQWAARKQPAPFMFTARVLYKRDLISISNCCCAGGLVSFGHFPWTAKRPRPNSAPR